MYLILMYLIPVTQFLNDVPTSDVSKSVTSSRYQYVNGDSPLTLSCDVHGSKLSALSLVSIECK